MHVDANKIDQGKLLEYDICIVGSGAAGITLAKEFIGTKYNVAILESGGFSSDPKTQSLYEGEVGDGLIHADLNVYRQRFFGGSTNCWGGGCLPYDKIDFEKRSFVDRSGWPIAYKEVLPYYDRAADYVQIEKADFVPGILKNPSQPHVIEGIAESGIFNTGYWRKNYTTPRFSRLFKDDIIDASNITLYTYANVVNIECNESGKGVEVVEVKTLKGSGFKVKSRAFILAMGGLEVPRMLLASNDKHKAGLGNDSNWVGRCYSPHVNATHGILILNQDLETHSSYEEISRYITCRRFLTVSEEAQKKEQILNCKITLEPVDRVKENYLSERLYRYFNDSYFNQYKDYNSLQQSGIYALQTAFEQTPNPESRVFLSEDKDQFGIPRLKLEHRLAEGDLEKYIRTYELLATTVGQLGIGRLSYDDTGQAILDQETGRSHHTGTTRMADSAQSGVVDKNCRVFGLDNLFVSSAGVFPTASQANPTFTIVAMAIRLADHLKSSV